MMRVRFWGTRGSMVCPGRATQRYGGNTPCVQVTGFEGSEPGAVKRSGNPQVILDCGSGISLLQSTLTGGVRGKGQEDLHILLSHLHWDHIIGLSFPFMPLLVKGNQITIYGSSAKDLQSSIERLFTSVYSPLTHNLAADLEYRQVESSGMDIAGFHIQAAENRHPGGSLSFRIQHRSCTMVYTSDHEAGQPRTDSRLVKLARGAQLWVLDGMYTEEERPLRLGYGHSTHLEAVKLATEAGVGKAVLFHHSVSHDDETLDRMGLEAAQAAAGEQTEVLIARDGMAMDVGGISASGQLG